MKLTVSLFVLFAVFSGCYSQFPQLGTTETSIGYGTGYNGDTIIESVFSLADSILGFDQAVVEALSNNFNKLVVEFEAAIANTLPLVKEFFPDPSAYDVIVYKLSNYTDQVTAYFNQNTENLKAALDSIPKPDLPITSQASIGALIPSFVEVFNYLSQVIIQVVQKAPPVPNFFSVLLSVFFDFVKSLTNFPKLLASDVFSGAGAFGDLLEIIGKKIIPSIVPGFNISAIVSGIPDIVPSWKL
ncbi:uncharacterized protein LOC126882886 [Diabrotica virgifera virgifera]|uniref:Uncharacterized protein n=1 Tax=Diabrotica virgifera virgifera TaxID=50390 RepID=A0ABM5K142_DIAVI|nr:uncharacterized protein LOC126882886 [Diabrotica virgifera virgifera]